MGSGVTEQPQSRLFISCSRKNKGQVYPFAKALTAAGINVWIDRDLVWPLIEPSSFANDSFSNRKIWHLRTFDWPPCGDWHTRQPIQVY